MINPEIRAAEIIALIATKYRNGGWTACMTAGEIAGWNIHENEWWTETNSEYAPRNQRELAGWLASEIYRCQVTP